jgi:hypothetical protein
MNARDIIKLAAQLYVYDALKKKITILTNIQKGKDINVDIFLPKVTDVTVSDFAKHLQKAIESQPEEERAKHRKFFGEPISFCRCVARGNLMASVLVEEFNSEVKKNKRKLRGIKKMFVSEVEFMLHKKQLNRIIRIQELKLKLLEKEIKINKIDTRIQLTAMAAILKPSEMSDTDFVLKINEKMSELWSEEALIRQNAKINQELLEIQKTLDEIEKQGDM